MKWNKVNTQRYISECECYAIVGRYTYYQGWTPCYLPNGTKGEYVSLDGMYKGKGSLATCRKICSDHVASNSK